MKKLLLITTALTLFFSGCSTQKQPKDFEINRNFEAEAVITQKSTAYTADFHFNENSCSAVFVLPEEIKGLEILYDGCNFTYRFQGLEHIAPPKNGTEQFLPLIYNTINDPDGIKTTEETHYSVSGNIMDYIYYLNLNKDTLIPTFLEIEEADLTVRFEQPKPKAE